MHKVHLTHSKGFQVVWMCNVLVKYCVLIVIRYLLANQMKMPAASFSVQFSSNVFPENILWSYQDLEMMHDSTFIPGPQGVNIYWFFSFFFFKLFSKYSLYKKVKSTKQWQIKKLLDYSSENIILDLMEVLRNAFIYTVDLSAWCVCWCYSEGCALWRYETLF